MNTTLLVRFVRLFVRTRRTGTPESVVADLVEYAMWSRDIPLAEPVADTIEHAFMMIPDDLEALAANALLEIETGRLPIRWTMWPHEEREWPALDRVQAILRKRQQEREDSDLRDQVSHAKAFLRDHKRIQAW